MRITEQTKYKDIEKLERYFSDKTNARITEAAQKSICKFVDLTFDDFWACCNGDFSAILGDVNKMRDPSVYEVYWLTGFKDFVEKFTKTLQNLTIKPTAEEKQAAEGLLEISFGEACLVFLQKYFCLHSFAEAGKITIGDLLIAKRAKYNEDKFQRNLSNIQLKKYKAKK